MSARGSDAGAPDLVCDYVFLYLSITLCLNCFQPGICNCPLLHDPYCGVVRRGVWISVT